MSKQLFGTDGIRGKANEWPITPEVAMKTGRAVARVMGSEGASIKVLIGRDTRVSGAMLESAMVAGLISEGAEVFLTGAVPTPAVAYLTQKLQCDAGVMLTASHNPFEDNGIKIFGNDGFKLTDELEAEVEKIILEESLLAPDPVNGIGGVEKVADAADQYAEFAKKAAGENALNGLKVVLDCANGAAHEVGPSIFSDLGAEVVSFGVSPDGKNINEGVGALHPEKAAELVAEHQADIGICFDGDADRVIFVDEGGQVISGDRVLCLCAKALKSEGRLKDDYLVATVMSNLGLRDALAEDGIQLDVTGVGDRLVIESMRKNGYSLGGENSGHIIFADNATTGDGIMSAIEVLGIMKRTGKKLSELAACMNEYPALLEAISVKDKPPIGSIPELSGAISSAEESMGDAGRVLVRYSGTEKKIRVLVEAKCADAAKEHTEAICSAVNATIGC